MKVLKSSTPGFAELLEEVVRKKQAGVYLAGGAVRDAFLAQGKEVKDLDIFITSEAFEIFQSYFETFGNLQINPFGTYRWYPHQDSKFYFDIIIIPRFFNGLWRCRDIVDALNQFDITINAIAFDLYTGELYDPQNGLRDISERKLRAVRFDYPDLPVSSSITISRNTVLWFRYGYYARILNLEIDALTLNWMQENRHRESGLEQFKIHFFDPDA